MLVDCLTVDFVSFWHRWIRCSQSIWSINLRTYSNNHSQKINCLSGGKRISWSYIIWKKKKNRNWSRNELVPKIERNFRNRFFANGHSKMTKTLKYIHMRGLVYLHFASERESSIISATTYHNHTNLTLRPFVSNLNRIDSG